MAIGSTLGSYLRERRTRLDPKALGYSGRRRTPGLRREEVAERAGISSTWYCWLEQGRGGPPSAHTLDCVAEALMLTEAEREHLFHLGLGRPPQIRRQLTGLVPERIQRILDKLDDSPAIVRNAAWDVVAWNATAAAVFGDYGSLPAEDRNLMRLMFLDPKARVANPDWDSIARFVVGVFRGDATRTGTVSSIEPMVDELCTKSPEFAEMWSDNDVNSVCEKLKRVRHDQLGEIAFEFSAFAVDGRPDLMMLVYAPVTDGDAARIRTLVVSTLAAPRGADRFFGSMDVSGARPCR
jgi:transcriptional regulator with XRE-family HTH domain